MHIDLLNSLSLIVAESTGTANIDINLVNELISLCKTCMGLFTEFPLNVFLISGLVGVGFGVFGMAKRATRK